MRVPARCTKSRLDITLLSDPPRIRNGLQFRANADINNNDFTGMLSSLSHAQSQLGGTKGHGQVGCQSLARNRSEEHTSELQSRFDLVCRLLLEKKKHKNQQQHRR